MKKLLLTFILLAASLLAADVEKITPAAAARRAADGSAVIVDVREPAEWKETGVVQGAVLLPKSDFDGAQKQWKEFLEKTEGKEIILYCRSGHRAGIVAQALAAQGRKVANSGGFRDWEEAGQPTRKVADSK